MTSDCNSTASRDVTAEIFYSRALPDNAESEPWFVTINCASNGEREKNYEEYPVQTTIHDIRGHEADTHLDVTGFQAVHSPSAVDPDLILDGTDEQIKEIYYGEVEQLIKRVTGANHVVFFDHTVRKVRPNLLDNNTSTRQPVLRAHVDQTPASAHVRVKRHASNIPWKRFQLINVWRPLKNPVYDYPLALVDFRTVDVQNDIVPTKMIYPSPLPSGEVYSVAQNPKHRWCYWSKMTPDEVILLKCYDSASRALSTVKRSAAQVDETQLKDVAGLAPHTGFYDVEAEKEGPSRNSIEVRALVFYD